MTSHHSPQNIEFYSITFYSVPMKCIEQMVILHPGLLLWIKGQRFQLGSCFASPNVLEVVLA